MLCYSIHSLDKFGGEALQEIKFILPCHFKVFHTTIVLSTLHDANQASRGDQARSRTSNKEKKMKINHKTKLY